MGRDILDQHELFDEIESFDVHWQTNFDTLRDAAEAAGCLPEYYDYMGTAEGKVRSIRFLGVPDTVLANRLERNMRIRMLRRSNRSDFDGGD